MEKPFIEWGQPTCAEDNITVTGTLADVFRVELQYHRWTHTYNIVVYSFDNAWDPLFFKTIYSNAMTPEDAMKEVPKQMLRILDDNIYDAKVEIEEKRSELATLRKIRRAMAIQQIKAVK